MDPELTNVLVVSMPNHAPRCFRINGNHIQIGRGKNNHLRIDHDAVSKTHCELVKGTEPAQWIFRDLGSTNGSELNRTSVGCDVFLVNDGDEIVLGNDVMLIFLSVHDTQVPESLIEEEVDPEFNPVAAAVARQSRDDLQGTQLIRVKSQKEIVAEGSIRHFAEKFIAARDAKGVTRTSPHFSYKIEARRSEDRFYQGAR